VGWIFFSSLTFWIFSIENKDTFNPKINVLKIAMDKQNKRRVGVRNRKQDRGSFIFLEAAGLFSVGIFEGI